MNFFVFGCKPIKNVEKIYNQIKRSQTLTGLTTRVNTLKKKTGNAKCYLPATATSAPHSVELQCQGPSVCVTLNCDDM